MLENIIVILLIIGLSHLFRINNNNKNNTFNSQMLFILLSLGIVVFYKMCYLKKIMNDKDVFFISDKFNNHSNTEFFQNNNNDEGSISSSLNQFAGAEITNVPSISNYELNKEQLDTLQANQDMLTSQIEALTKDKNELGIFDNSMDIQELEAINKQELLQLETDINKLSKKVVTPQNNQYTPIKIYNSCDMSEASGTTTEDGAIQNNSNIKHDQINPADISAVNEYHAKLENITTLTNSLKQTIGDAITFNLNEAQN
jgi:hypothetical protein